MWFTRPEGKLNTSDRHATADSMPVRLLDKAHDSAAGRALNFTLGVSRFVYSFEGGVHVPHVGHDHKMRTPTAGRQEGGAAFVSQLRNQT